ncbi:MAG: hypothetical protein HY896_01300 [Deltaproteobacteria bacterium]|nr:hypothetical protein [Deltaproteobacteria bacterium]
MTAYPKNRRKIIFINPRVQGGTALFFSAIVVAGALLFAWVVYDHIRLALWDATYRGHFMMRTPYQIVDDIVMTHLVTLFLGVLAASIIAFFLLIRRIRAGILKVAEALAISAEGDLSTPTNAPGLKEIRSFGEQLDAARSLTLSRVREIRQDLELLRSGAATPDERRLRWEELKGKIGRMSP